jgi:hypothetical protein
MQVFLEPDEPRVLPIPYWTRGDPGRRFWNVKKDPALVRRIGELRGCPELRAFIVGVNGPRSRLASLGCDHWTKPADHGGGPVFEAGLYVDLVFDRVEVAAKKRNLLDLVRRLRERSRPGSAKPATTVVRLQPQRAHFRGVRPDTVWMLSVWVFGAGRSRSVARARRRRGLEAVRSACAAASREIARRAGRSGTPIPP